MRKAKRVINDRELLQFERLFRALCKYMGRDKLLDKLEALDDHNPKDFCLRKSILFMDKYLKYLKEQHNVKDTQDTRTETD